MTIFLTILSGVIVFVFGQTILKLFVEPWQMQRECIAKISNTLLVHANVYLNSGMGDKEKLKQVSKETRNLAAELVASCNRLPFYETLAKMKLFPSLSTISEVQKNLIGLSNGVYSSEGENNHVRLEKVNNLLNLKLTL